MTAAQDPASGSDPRLPRIANPQALATQTADFANTLAARVTSVYLDFRRTYYHESNPSMATVPPTQTEELQTESAKIATQALRLMPREIGAIPIARDLLNQLQWEVDINTLTERERVQLHNMAMALLLGIQGGIQAWYVEWLNEFAHRLASDTHPDYYLAYPWHGLIYRTPDELAIFDRAVATGNVTGVEHEIERYATALMACLAEPLHTQRKLAFSGPDAERREAIFTLKTRAALALGAYLAIETVRGLLSGRHRYQPPQSVMQSFPPEVMQHVLPEGAPPQH